MKGTNLLKKLLHYPAKYARFEIFGDVVTVDLGTISVDVVISSLPEYGSIELFEEHESEMIAQFLGDIKHGDRVFDIGANIGLYALAAAKQGADIVGFEPHPVNRERLEENQVENEVSLVVDDRALGSDADQLHLTGTLNDYAGHGSSVLTPNGEGFEVDVTTMDAVVETYGVPNIVKIDVEGGEKGVIEGMAQTLMRDALRTIYLEMHEHVLSVAEVEEIRNTLTNAGFTLTVLEDERENVTQYRAVR